MAWPRKNTRTVVISSEVYQWHWDPRQSLYRWVVIRKKSADGQLLFLDPYFLSTTPGMVCQAIAFALAAGWKPCQKDKPIRLGSRLLDPDTFTFGFNFLPDDAVLGQMPWTLGAGGNQHL